MNPFEDQRLFMQACGQTTDFRNAVQVRLYGDLINEEYTEWAAAVPGSVEDLDAVMDQIVVLIGYALSQGWDVSGAWKEVMRSNFDKVDAETGAVRRRADGKILKPDGWRAPDLRPFMTGGMSAEEPEVTDEMFQRARQEYYRTRRNPALEPEEAVDEMIHRMLKAAIGGS